MTYQSLSLVTIAGVDGAGIDEFVQLSWLLCSMSAAGGAGWTCCSYDGGGWWCSCAGGAWALRSCEYEIRIDYID